MQRYDVCEGESCVRPSKRGHRDEVLRADARGRVPDAAVAAVRAAAATEVHGGTLRRMSDPASSAARIAAGVPIAWTPHMTRDGDCLRVPSRPTIAWVFSQPVVLGFLAVGAASCAPPVSAPAESPTSRAPAPPAASPSGSIAWLAPSASAAPKPALVEGPCAGAKLVQSSLRGACLCDDVGESIGLGTGPRQRCPNHVPEGSLVVSASTPKAVRAGEDIVVEVAVTNAGPAPLLFRAIAPPNGAGMESDSPAVLFDANGKRVGPLFDPSCPRDGLGLAGTVGGGGWGNTIGVTLAPGGRLEWTYRVATKRSVLAPLAVQPPPAPPPRRPGAKPRPPRPPSVECEEVDKPLPPGKYVVRVTPRLAPAELVARVGLASAEVELLP